ncbi:sulfite exporter TauE/SafE family protein [Aneurinibacillus terranovensis]|uniref:sulfite exporter TauE/SafE family protein n=1 Tax=Aneurinibacillus terranovensis TaxID=278991 RepID=UPI00041FBC67|nr:sulfite exporter TauE/SafE family protein [Aneurinibacillus terranovensis]
MLWLLFILIGIVAGAFGSLLGLGGGIILVPALLYLTPLLLGNNAITPQSAVGTSLMLIIITAFSSTLSYAKRKLIDYQSVLWFFIGSAPGAVIGAYLTRFFNKTSFSIYDGLFMILMVFMLFIRKKLSQKNIHWKTIKTYTDEAGDIHTYGYSKIFAVVVALILGILSSLFGIGGGSLLMPVLLVLFRFPPHIATATSMCLIFFSSIVGSISHIVYGNVIWKLVLTTAPGAWLGGKLGAALSRRFTGNGLETLLRYALLLIALRMLWEGIM